MFLEEKHMPVGDRWITFQGAFGVIHFHALSKAIIMGRGRALSLEGFVLLLA